MVKEDTSKLKVKNKILMDPHLMSWSHGSLFWRILRLRLLWVSGGVLLGAALLNTKPQLEAMWDDRELRAAQLMEEIHEREGAYNRERYAKRKEKL